MPRYFFNIHDGRETLDREGTVLAGRDEARSQAVVVLGEMMKDIDGDFWDGCEWRMWVVDESGTTVCTLKVTGE